MRARLRNASLRARIALGVGLLVIVAGVVSSVGGGSELPLREPPAQALGPERPKPGQVVRTPDGKVLKGPDGKPVRLAKDGRTLVDSEGRPLRSASGEPLRLRSDGTLPPAALELAEDRAHDAPGGGDGVGLRPNQKPRWLHGEPVVLGITEVDSSNALPYDTAQYPHVYAISEAVKRYVNSTGGIAGRPLELKHVKVVEDNRTSDAIKAQECQDYLEGRRPLAVIELGTWLSLARCLQPHGIAVIGGTPWAASTGELAEHPNVFSLTAPSYDRWPRHYVAALERQGFFGRGTRVGFGYARGGRMFGAGVAEMRRALREAGVNVVAEVGVNYPRSITEYPRVISDIANAVVRFRAAGVDRLIVADAAAGLGLFMGFAEAQGYRPKYGISTTSIANGVVANAPRPQLENIVAGIGWSPLLDVAAGQDPTDGKATRRECYGILRGAGVPVGERGVYGAFAALTYCDSLLAARAALERSRRFTMDGLSAGLEGAQRESGLNFRTRIDASRHDGNAGYRDTRYFKNCGCMRYEGSVRALD